MSGAREMMGHATNLDRAADRLEGVVAERRKLLDQYLDRAKEMRSEAALLRVKALGERLLVDA